MSKNYALFDWDNTTRKGYTLFSWIYYLREHNIIPEGQYNEINEIRLLYDHGLLTHDQYARFACKKYAESLQGVSESIIQQALSGYMSIDRKHLFANINEVFNILYRNDIDIIVISGAPTIVVESYAQEFHIKRIYAFKEEIYNGAFTGNVDYNYGFDKTTTVDGVITSYGKKPLVAFGDSSSDIPMLEVATNAFCIGGGLEGYKKISITKNNRIPQRSISEIKRIIER